METEIMVCTKILMSSLKKYEENSSYTTYDCYAKALLDVLLHIEKKCEESDTEESDKEESHSGEKEQFISRADEAMIEKACL